jgi:TatD DNase family protein
MSSSPPEVLVYLYIFAVKRATEKSTQKNRYFRFSGGRKGFASLPVKWYSYMAEQPFSRSQGAMLIDTHCHLDDPALLSRLPEVLAAAAQARVARIIVPGVGPDGWPAIAALAREVKRVHAAFGLHPMHACLSTSGLLADLARILPGAVAVGEIGLDYTLPEVPREIQQEAFRGQLRLAAGQGLPVLIHCRRAFQDLLRILREEGVERVGGVMHAFSGSPEIAWECVRLGLYISVAGTVTYENAVRPLEVVRQISLDHILLETDAPDMTPEPCRGRVNEPAFLVETARKVSGIKGVIVEEVARVTTANAERLFRI